MYDDQLYSISAGFSPHIVTGNGNLDSVLKHDLYHLGHSRALNDLFLANYGLQGLYALILKGHFCHLSFWTELNASASRCTIKTHLHLGENLR